MKIIRCAILVGLLFLGAHAQAVDEWVDDIEAMADNVETLCDSNAASLPDVESFCDFALQGDIGIARDTFQLTPVSSNLSGCIEAESSSSGSGLELHTCNSSKDLQKFKFDGKKFHPASDESKCWRIGRHANTPPGHGNMIRVVDCANSSHQLFDWDGSGPIKHADYCVVSRGINAASGDTIIIVLCSQLDQPRSEGWKEN